MSAGSLVTGFAVDSLGTPRRRRFSVSPIRGALGCLRLGAFRRGAAQALPGIPGLSLSGLGGGGWCGWGEGGAKRCNLGKSKHM